MNPGFFQPPRGPAHAWLSRGILIAALGVASACSPSAPPAAATPAKACPPRELAVSMVASQRVNPTPEGQGRPVQVRAYQLLSDARLRNAPFEDIWQKDKEVLQTDLVSVDQYSLFPGETKELGVKPNARAHYFALVALFREPQGKDWYLSFELAEPAATPPCPSKPRISAWLDRMQIQDGQGRAEETLPQTTPFGKGN